MPFFLFFFPKLFLSAKTVSFHRAVHTSDTEMNKTSKILLSWSLYPSGKPDNKKIKIIINCVREHKWKRVIIMIDNIREMLSEEIT